MAHRDRTVRARFGLLAGWSACVALVAAAGTAFALPPNPQLPQWAGPQNNCYNYGINQRDNDFKQPGNDNYTLPNNPSSAQVGAQVLKGAKNDGLVNIDWTPGDPIPAPPDGYNLVALGATGTNDWDYHWWRLNGDGTWSHKRGQTPAKTTYTDAQGQEQTFDDPRDADQRDGYDLIGFMGTPKTPVGELQDGLDVLPNSMRVWDLRHSGPEDFYGDFFNLSELLSHMPTGSAIPDPLWGGVDAGESMGFGFCASSLAQAMGFPVYMRVFEGVVGVYSDLNGNNITYYIDNNGLARAVPAPGAAMLLALGGVVASRRRRVG